MRQRFRVDPRRAGAYLAAAVLGTGCAAGQPARLVPATAAPVSRSQVESWVAPTAPTANLLYRFTWRYRDEVSSAGGRGSVRIAPPDSLRLDVAGPLGSGKSAAVVVGEEKRWAEPEDAIRKLVPNFPLMWAMVGVARLPAPGAELRGLSEGGTTAWQYVSGGDTIAYARTLGKSSRLVAEVRQGGKVVGRAETELQADGTPVRARLTVPSVPARLDLTFTASTRPSAFPPDTWSPPAP
jgi:hypothetical protein